MIEVNISRRVRAYAGIQDLQVNHAFKTSAITQILGISGVGKSTFLKMFAGLVKPDSGTIRCGDREWFNAETRVNVPTQLRNLGFVFQDYALFPNMTVEEHLLFGTPDRKQVNALLSLGRMQPFSRHKPKQLSGGQQQRLAILRALSTNPSVLLMDEPFSALDKTLRSQMLPELKDLILSNGITCLVVTHDKLNEFASDDFEML